MGKSQRIVKTIQKNNNQFVEVSNPRKDHNIVFYQIKQYNNYPIKLNLVKNQQTFMRGH